VTALHIVVPDGIDDPARPSGGNVYDLRICSALVEMGWPVEVHAVPGSWPRPDAAAYEALDGVVQQIPDGAVALVDGLVGSTAPDVLVPHSTRLRLVALVHMPLGRSPDGNGARTREGAVLSSAAAVVTTSAWGRRTLLDLYSLPQGRVHVAEPGVDAAPLSQRTTSAGALLCVASVVPEKGHDVLLDALSTLTELSWTCLCVGSTSRDPDWAESVQQRVLAEGLETRVRFAGPRTGAELAETYASADLLVLASRTETYGMVVTEALARGVPVVAAAAGGVAEAVGHDSGGNRPGLLVPPEDAAALSRGLRTWLCRADMRGAWRSAACERRESLPRWSATASALNRVLAEAAR
jgi:glycosyltransferase involved in cell wall biosynthesis